MIPAQSRVNDRDVQCTIRSPMSLVMQLLKCVNEVGSVFDSWKGCCPFGRALGKTVCGYSACWVLCTLNVYSVTDIDSLCCHRQALRWCRFVPSTAAPNRRYAANSAALWRRLAAHELLGTIICVITCESLGATFADRTIQEEEFQSGATAASQCRQAMHKYNAYCVVGKQENSRRFHAESWRRGDIGLETAFSSVLKSSCTANATIHHRCSVMYDAITSQCKGVTHRRHRPTCS